MGHRDLERQRLPQSGWFILNDYQLMVIRQSLTRNSYYPAEKTLNTRTIRPRHPLGDCTLVNPLQNFARIRKKLPLSPVFFSFRSHLSRLLSSNCCFLFGGGNQIDHVKNWFHSVVLFDWGSYAAERRCDKRPFIDGASLHIRPWKRDINFDTGSICLFSRSRLFPSKYILYHL